MSSRPKGREPEPRRMLGRVMVPAEPELADDDRLAVAKAVMRFNRGLYFECHELLEDVWSRLRGPSRDFFQALIQVSVGFHHLERGNRAGATKTFAKARARLDRYPARYFGFDVAAERRRLEDPAAQPPPRWRFENLPVVADPALPSR